MKKAISLVLTLCCLITAFPFCAYAKYDKEICFRDIPWGCTAKEAMEYLSDLDIEWNGFYNMPYRGNVDIMIYEPPKDIDYYTICFNESTNINETVAGYDLEKITLYFAFTDMDKPYLEYTSLYMAIYDFSSDTIRDRESEKLMESIISTYGDFDSVDTYKNPYTYVVGAINGRNNSSVNYIADVIGGGVYGARIVYTGGDGAEIAKKNMELLKKNTPVNNDGL